MTGRGTTSFFLVALISLVSIQQSMCQQKTDVFTLVVSSRKNQTGHTVAEASIDKEGRRISNEWKLKVHHSSTDRSGIQTFHLSARAVAPPPRPADYTFFPGIGYYKYHSEYANGFDDAIFKCASEGGHLVVINSEAEHGVVRNLFAQNPRGVWAFVGFHDRIKEGEYLTIFGEPLSSTGFSRFLNGQPDDWGRNEDCGSIHHNGGLNDITCGNQHPFICEYDLSWAESFDP